MADKASDAFYKLSNTRSQIQAYVFDVISASVPKLNLDDAFEQKNAIAKAVEDELEKAMSAYDYEICSFSQRTTNIGGSPTIFSTEEVSLGLKWL